MSSQKFTMSRQSPRSIKSNTTFGKSNTTFGKSNAIFGKSNTFGKLAQSNRLAFSNQQISPRSNFINTSPRRLQKLNSYQIEFIKKYINFNG